jgi:hypothetical protein
MITSTGCAKTDWIDRTLVTVDVTGTWYGGMEGTGWGTLDGMFFELKQEGSRVTGSIRFPGGATVGQGGTSQGPIEGAVTGDMFRFRQVRGNLEGELTVSGDEMNGRVSMLGTRPFSLRRVESSSRPYSPPR